MTVKAREPQAEDVEFKLFFEGLRLRYGYDFGDYAEASLRRRLRALLLELGLPSISALQGEVLTRADLLPMVLSRLTVPTTEMFRDPAFFLGLREHVLPMLSTYSTFKIWHAGCSTGEEVVSLAILLTEAGLYDRAVIYATDVNPIALKQAQDGIYQADELKKFTKAYHDAGGRESFSDYYSVAYGAARFSPDLRRNVVFAGHNLVTDDVFSEVHLILCRNVFIYFNKELQARVLNLFARSLCYKGYLGLGDKETVRLLPGASAWEELPGTSRIFRKIARDAPPVDAGRSR